MLNFDMVNHLTSIGAISPSTASQIANILQRRTLNITSPKDVINPQNPGSGFSVQQAGNVINGQRGYLSPSAMPSDVLSPDLSVPVNARLKGIFA